jgi:hypothetical protein
MYLRPKYTEENKDWETIPDPVGSIKHDGANFFLVVGKDGGLRFFSRRQSVKGDFPERTSQLPHLTEKKLPDYAGNVYNVELVHTGHSSLGKEDHPALSGMLNSLPEKSIQTQKDQGPIRVILLNVIHPKINTYGEKLQHLKEVSKNYDNPTILRPVSIKIGKDNIQDLINETKRMGQEGVIITSSTIPEDSNTRIKVKHTNTWNLKVSKINQEYDISGNPKNSAGALTVVDASGREVANVGTGFSKELRQQIWNNQEKWLGKEIQVKARTPSRRRLLAPVYNGDSDGSMDKVAETIETQLLINLMDKYQKGNVNPQKILDNSLFQQLPLSKKIEFIESIGNISTQKPRMDLNNVRKGLLGGALSGTMTGLLGAAAIGGNPKVYASYGGVAGAAFGGLGGLIRSIMDKSRDMETYNSSKGSGLDALVNRSTSSPIEGSPFGTNKYLSTLESLAETHGPGLVKTQYP